MEDFVENISIAGQAMKFARLAKKATDCANPYQASFLTAKEIVIN